MRIIPKFKIHKSEEEEEKKSTKLHALILLIENITH